MRSSVLRLARRLVIALMGSGALIVVSAQAAHAGIGNNHCEPVVTL